jgi:phosphatidylglycerol:prolipoprotein diacylglycerol transferase
MCPLIHIGKFYFETYWIIFVLTILICIIPFIKEARRKNISPKKVGFFLCLALPLSFIFAHIYYWVFYNPETILKNPGFIFLFWKGGLAFHGGIGGGIFLGLLFTRINKISFWKFADLFAPLFALGESIQRIGCFLNGCCYGKETDLIWSVMFTHPNSMAPQNIYLHPTQIYLSFGSLFVFIFLWTRRTKIKYNGQTFLNYLILHAILRSIVEEFRADALYWMGTSFKTAHITGIISIIFSLLMKAYLKKKTSQN